MVTEMIYSIEELRCQGITDSRIDAANILKEALKLKDAYFEIDPYDLTLSYVIPVSNNYDLKINIMEKECYLECDSPNLNCHGLRFDYGKNMLLDIIEFINAFILVYKTIFSS